MKTVALAFLTAIGFGAYAQKLPAVQQISLRAPANVKVDGKATEWGGKLQAYNQATEVFYTMANDDKKLYLIVQASSPGVINNIANGGIRLAIQKAGSKSDTGAPFIKFPYTQPVSSLMVTPQGKGNPDEEAGMNDYNKQLHANTKWIYNRGLGGVDTLLSVYNDSGIAAANAIDVKRVYTCELAIDLSLLGLAIEKVQNSHIILL